jgi:hypothetical protein
VGCEPPRAKAAFELIKPELAKLSPESLGKINIDISQAVVVGHGDGGASVGFFLGATRAFVAPRLGHPSAVASVNLLLPTYLAHLEHLSHFQGSLSFCPV